MANITAEQLAECKLFMKVDTTADDTVIKGLLSASVEYMRSAGIAESWSDLYKLAVHALTLHWYDHRDDIQTDKVMPPGLRPVINQLKAEGFAGSIIDAGGV